jgi:hypothetical protein
MSDAKRSAWIEVISEQDAQGLLRELDEKEWDRHHNLVDNVLKVHSLHPGRCERISICIIR